MSAAAVFSDALRAVQAMERGKSTLDDFLDFQLQHPQFRRTTAFLLGSELRHRAFLRRVLAEFVPRMPGGETEALLRLGAAQIFYSDALPPEKLVNALVEFAPSRLKGFVNAVLRKVAAACKEERFREDVSARAVLPEAVFREWSNRFSREELDGFAAAFLSVPEFVFRSCNGALDAETVEKYSLEKVRNTVGNWHFYTAESPGKVLASELLEGGRIYVQDTATVLASELLDGREFSPRKILDMCAAPGGKSLLLHEKFPAAELYAYDRSPRRRSLLRENFSRYLPGDGRCRVLDAPEQSKPYDLIFADAPCSNTGVFRRRPDVLYRYSPQMLQEAVKLQRDILEKALEMLAPGGYLLYSTCSIEEAENQLQSAAFVRRHANVSLLNETFRLPSPDGDGAYGALFVKK